MEIFLHGDPRDKHDMVKWDFSDNSLFPVLGNDGYIYKLVETPNSNFTKGMYYYNTVGNNKLKKLEQIRAKVANVAHYIHTHINEFPPETHNGLKLFVSIHAELPRDSMYFNEMTPEQRNNMKMHWVSSNGYTSGIIYSEMPPGKPFRGLNKPMDRYINPKVPFIGKDENLRSKWRHIFLQLPNDNKDLSEDKELQDLVIHEVAHTAANHQRWRNDDHGNDFHMYEDIIKKVWSIT